MPACCFEYATLSPTLFARFLLASLFQAQTDESSSIIGTWLITYEQSHSALQLSSSCSPTSGVLCLTCPLIECLSGQFCGNALKPAISPVPLTSQLSNSRTAGSKCGQVRKEKSLSNVSGRNASTKTKTETAAAMVLNDT